mgnify:CR=1 FL=1
MTQPPTASDSRGGSGVPLVIPEAPRYSTAMRSKSKHKREQMRRKIRHRQKKKQLKARIKEQKAQSASSGA